MIKKLLAFVMTQAIVFCALPWKNLSVSAATGMSPSGTANLKVIDISNHQNGKISDWSLVAQNVNAVYMKATEGNTYTDAYAASFAASAQSVGLPYGFYTYFWPRSDLSKAVAEADFFYNTIKNYNYGCIPVLDIENNYDNTTGITLSKSEITASVQAFATEFKKISGIDIMIYASPYFINTYLDSSLSSYKFWIANYTADSQPMDTCVWHQWDMWQYTDSLSVPGISEPVDANIATSNIFMDSSGSATSVGVGYAAHVQNIGWQNPVENSAVCGTTGQSLRTEAIKISLENAPAGLHISYSAHVQNLGWQDWVTDGATAGTTGSSLRMEALKIKLSGTDSDKYTVKYQAHVENIGWQDWVYDGQTAGTTGRSLRIEALRIMIVPKTPLPVYQSHVQNIGWQDEVTQNAVSGTTGSSLRMEALKICLLDAPDGLSVTYRAHVQNIGWQDWLSGGAVTGTTGCSLRMEALQIKLQGTDADKYTIQYRAHVQNIGWQNWVSDGDTAGTTGQSLRVEAIQIRVIPKT